MATSPYADLQKSYQDQILSVIEQSQNIAVESVAAWAKAAQPLTKAVPAAPASALAPTAKELVESSFGFATRLLDAQHSYWTAVLAAAEPAMPKTPAAK